MRKTHGPRQILLCRPAIALLATASLTLAGCAEPAGPAAATLQGTGTAYAGLSDAPAGRTAADASITTHPILLQPAALQRGRVDDLPAELVLSGSGRQTTMEATSWHATTAHTGLWSGEIGTYRVDSYPDNEVFTLLTGAVDLVSPDGSRVEVRPGTGVFVPKGWKGTWHTLAPTTKTFVTTD